MDRAAENHYPTSETKKIKVRDVASIAAPDCVLFLWATNPMLPAAFAVMKAWGFTYKSNIVWHKVRKDGGSDGRGVGFYFRNVTELILFGVRGKNARTLAPGRRQVNLLATRKRETRANQMSSTRLSRPAVPDHTWNYSPGVYEGIGQRGAIRRIADITPRGKRMRIIRQQGI